MSEPSRRERMTARAKAGWLGKLVALMLVPLFFLVVEGVARMASDASQLDAILDVLQRDAELFWRNRPDLDTTFAGKAVFTDDSGFRIASEGSEFPPPGKERARVICMGASPTFGWGVAYDETYSAQLETRLKAAGVTANVLNAGMIGYSSHQGRLLHTREILAKKPDLITVAYVINDVDKYRFYRTTGTPDRTLEPANALLTGMWNLLDRSRFVAWYQDLLASAMGGSADYDGKPVELYEPKRMRVPPEDYRANLIAILQEARDAGIAVVFIKMPVNLPVGKAMPPSAMGQVDVLLQRGQRKEANGDIAAALDDYRQAVTLNPDVSAAWHRIGVLERNRGDLEAAKAAFDQAFEAESRRCGRDGLRYNAIMQTVAQQYGVPLVDVPEAFARTTDYLFISPQDDPIHPNRQGHFIIGEILAPVVENALRDKVHGKL